MHALSFDILRRIVSRVLPLLTLLFLASCNEELIPVDKVDSSYTINPDGTITIHGSVYVPGMESFSTRGVFAETAGPDLKVTLIEFEYSGDVASSFYTNTYPAIVTSKTDVPNDGTLVTFDVTVLARTDSRVLYLVVADDYVAPTTGSAVTVLTSLSVGAKRVGDTDETEGEETEAYWSRLEFRDGYCKEVPVEGEAGKYETVLRPEFKTAMTAVPVIRNFAQINMSVADDLQDRFQIEGFQLVNVPTAGTVGPYNSLTGEIPQLLELDGGEKITNKMKSYADISKIYSGQLSPYAVLRNTEASARLWTSGMFTPDGTNPDGTNLYRKYMYERPYNSKDRTYILLLATYTGTDADGNPTTPVAGYYKLDIGKPNDDGGFDYCNIIRNIKYNVVITNVLAPGVGTVGAAIDRAPFNNLIAATETSGMLNVSDGQRMLIVNDTNHIIITQNKQVEVLYRYIPDISDSNTSDNSLAHPSSDLKVGDVIASWVGPKEVTVNGEKWMQILITPQTPTSTLVKQDFTIVDGQGLGRTIHLFLRSPWQYAPITVGTGNNATSYSATIANGTADYYAGTPQVISDQALADVTVYFRLPAGLEEAMFPLEFRLEAKQQGIENNPIGTLVVWTGTSLFPSTPPGSEPTTIQYIKTVTYDEYYYAYDGKGQLNVNVPDPTHTIRCRFRTIKQEATTQGDIVIYNEYFTPNAEVKFTRGTVSN